MTQENLADRLRRFETRLNDIPGFSLPATDDDYRVQAAYELAATSASIAAKLTQVTITFLQVEDPNVERYEVWVSRIANGADKPYLAASVESSPATFNVVSTGAGNALAYVRTVMKNGLTMPLTASPSITFQVF